MPTKYDHFVNIHHHINARLLLLFLDHAALKWAFMTFV